MKKLITLALGLVLLSVGTYFYRDRSIPELPEISSQENTQADAAKAPPQAQSPAVSSTPTVANSDQLKKISIDPESERALDAKNEGTLESPSEKGERQISKEEMEKLENYFVKVEKDWKNKMRNMIMTDFKLGSEVFKQYEVLREGLERDKMEAFEEFHSYMRDKYGDNYTYNPTEDEDQFSKKLHEDYADRLRKLLGEENYKRYLEEKERENRRLKDEQDPAIGTATIEM